MELVLEGVTQQLTREHNERAWLAWHIVAVGKAKKMPKLSDLTRKTGATAPRRRQSAFEIEAVMRSWFASRRR
jgi:hypothetical protein